MKFKSFLPAQKSSWLIWLLLVAAISGLWRTNVVYAMTPATLDEVDPFGDTEETDAGAGDPADNAQPIEMLAIEEEEQPDDTSPATPEKQQAAQLLAQFLALKPQARQPASVLQALAAQARAKATEKEKAVAKPNAKPSGQAAEQRNEVRKFVQGVAVGDWASIKQYLASLPPEIGPQVYNHLLQLLNQPEQPSILLPGEILPLADAAPKELTAQQLIWLGALLKKSLRFTAQPQDLMTHLKAGTDRLGGKQTPRRLAAARLLLAAGLLDEAGIFAPTLNEALHESGGEMLNLLGDLQQARAAKSQDPADLARAWDLTQAILLQPDLTTTSRYLAVARALRLVAAAPVKSGDQWLQDLFAQRPELGMFVLAQLGSSGKASPDNVLPGGVLPGSDSPLRLQQRVIAQLLSTAADVSPWGTALNMLTAGWIEQAERSLGGAPAANSGVVRQRVNNSRQNIILQLRQSQRTGAWNNRNNGPPPAAEVLAAGPDDVWLKAVNPDLARKVRQLQGMLAAHAGDRQRVFAAIDAALPAEAELAAQFAERFLQSWAQSIKPTGNDNFLHGMNHRYGGSDSEGISLTRARQVRNLAQYAELLTMLNSRGLPPVKPEVLVSVFEACHSPAEVYRDADLQQVFGPPEDWSPEVATALVVQMRQKLAGQWRNPQLQNNAGTHRTDKEQVAGVVRGYAEAERLLDAACAKTAASWELELLRAVVRFDQSEFAYGQQAPLQAYTALRDRAFAAFRHAAEIYAASLKKLPLERQSVEVYQAWFQAALGASDLAFLLPNHKADLDQIGQLRQALTSLPENARPRHVALFGESLHDAAGSVPSQLKPQYYREVVRVLDDHPSADAARQKMAFYAELLDEVHLHLEIDGTADVGHDEPFGVQLAIRSTDTMTRESGNFQPLLQSLQAVQVGGRFQQTDDVRKKLDAEIKDKFGKSFVINSVRFHDPNVKPRAYGRDGWLETPLGYLLLKPKDPSVDRLPPLELDMTFNDGNGEVLLPITSPVVLMNANSAGAPVHPLADVKIKQLLDDRQLAHGLLRLEISAAAKGILGKLEDVLDVSARVPAGFAIKDVRDQAVEVVALDAASDRVAPLSERSWVVDYEPLADANAAEFAFPPARDAAAQLAYEHYADADLVECASTVPIRQSLLGRSGQLWVWGAAAGTIALMGALAGMLYRARLRQVGETPAAAYSYPAHVTAFNLLLLLKRIQADASQRLAESERASLSQTVAELERRHFARQAEDTNGEDLRGILDRWMARVGVSPAAPR